MESVNILKKALDNLKGQVVRVDQEIKVSEAQLALKKKELQDLLIRAKNIEISIEKLEKINASKNKKTKR